MGRDRQISGAPRTVFTAAELHRRQVRALASVFVLHSASSGDSLGGGIAEGDQGCERGLKKRRPEKGHINARQRKMMWSGNTFSQNPLQHGVGPYFSFFFQSGVRYNRSLGGTVSKSEEFLCL